MRSKQDTRFERRLEEVVCDAEFVENRENNLNLPRKQYPCGRMVDYGKMCICELETYRRCEYTGKKY